MSTVVTPSHREAKCDLTARAVVGLVVACFVSCFGLSSLLGQPETPAKSPQPETPVAATNQLDASKADASKADAPKADPSAPPTIGPIDGPKPIKKAWEYSPYAIEVWFDNSCPEISPAGRVALAATLLQRAEIVAGPTWRMEIVDSPPRLKSFVRSDLARVTPDQIQEAAPQSLKKDKIILAVLAGDDHEYRITAREIDCRTRVWGPIVVRTFRQPQRMASECFDAIAEAFLPVARIEDVRGKEAIVRIRASGLFYGEPSPATIKVGDVLQPIMRHNDRLGEPKKGGIFVVPWTYVHLLKEGLTTHTGQVYAARRGILGGRSSARIERYGRLVRTIQDSSEVFVKSKSKVPRPLAGYDIYSKNPEVELAEVEKEAEQQTPAVLLGRTDWRGWIKVDKGDHPLRVLYIKSGAKLLARLPVVPGAETPLFAEVAPDDQRLQTEGFTKGIQTQVLDQVCRKNLFAARIRKKITEKKLDEAGKMLDELRAMPSKEQMLQQISSHETKLTETNPTIDKLLADSKNLVSNYINQKLVDELIQEYARARQGGQ